MSAPSLASDCAMVMAAGLGKRMRPLTDSRPKPLVEVAGKALIDYSLDALAFAGVARAVVNVHYLADMLEAHLAARTMPQIAISDERALVLETGGGMVKAQGLLADPFFCLNSDNIWTDGAQDTFQALSAGWDAEVMDALLLVVPHDQAGNYHGAGDFKLDQQGRIARRGEDATAPFIYTGIQIVSYRLLRDAPEGAFSTNILWERAIGEGRLFGMEHQGQWFEVGDPAAIAPTEAALARG
jgi:N-acetyl-alpha-D-muramate 1-phosphate uridylyltransferase